ncbi:MAG TPA: P-type conjugative transfer protein TrbJ [Sphingobium sp.]|uniref:P-type conjugative transfer protein TrbJ n=1 Tax=Sphingobium sp. TaxID=1912891 RepID=UPI002ED4E47E
MPRFHIPRPIAASALAGLGFGTIVAIVMPTTPARAIIVFDPSNYSQNILTAARTLAQINNQIQSLQNEASMLMNMGKNLATINFPEIAALQQTLQQIDRLMGQAQGINFQVSQLERQFKQLYPTGFGTALTTNGRVQAARARLDASMSAFQQTMTVQSQVVGNVHDDAQTLSEIVSRSQGAQGSLQAQQATNQLLALTAKQQFQIQQMMAAQYRSDATEQSRRAADAAQAQATTKQFLGSGSAYTPQ